MTSPVLPAPIITSIEGPVGGKRTGKQNSSHSHRRLSKVLSAPAPEAERWKDQVSTEIYESIGEEERKRQEVIFELIRTEKEYLRDLGIIQEIFLSPLRAKKILTPKELLSLFSSVDQLRPLNEELLAQLEARFSKNPVIQQVGDIFVNLAEYFKLYKVFCRNHPYSVIEYQKIRAEPKNKKFRAFEEECFKKPECRMMDLQSFLLKPVQRICKYPLLIREILKFTEEDHVDRVNLEKAYANIQVIVQIVNEATKEEANMRRIVEIQKTTERLDLLTGGRKLLYEEVVIALDQEGKKKEDAHRNIYLFNDLLVVTKPKEKEKGLAELLANLKIQEVKDPLTTPNEDGDDPSTLWILQKLSKGSSSFSSKDSHFRMLAQFKDEDSKKRFLLEFSNALSWQEREEPFSPPTSAPPSRISLETSSPPRSSSSPPPDSTGLQHLLPFFRDVEDVPLCPLIPENPGEIREIKVCDVVILPNTISQKFYKSFRHMLIMIKVEREGGEYEIYKSFEETSAFDKEIRKSRDQEFPKFPTLGTAQLIKIDIAAKKVDEISKYFVEILGVLQTEREKEMLHQFLTSNSAPFVFV